MREEHSLSAPDGYRPLFQTLRGEAVESVHFGAVAVVTSQGNLFASVGDPWIVTFLRSSAKPLQTIPLIELGGLDRFRITSRELALTCASHSGTDRHLKVLYALQQKIGVSENDLLCCTHPPFDPASRKQLRDQGVNPSQNHHNCSGKHTGMLAQADLLDAPRDEYTEIDHPVQQGILRVICEMAGLPPDRIALGRDGCSVPTFALPLAAAARAWARLVDPSGLPENRARACRQITAAMRDHPFQVAGPGRLDTRLMEVAPTKLVSKAGAEAYQALGIFPGAISMDSPALGVAIKVADGDQGKRARRGITLEVLRQLGVLTADELADLSDLGPEKTSRNQCGILTGREEPCFQLQYN